MEHCCPNVIDDAKVEIVAFSFGDAAIFMPKPFFDRGKEMYVCDSLLKGLLPCAAVFSFFKPASQKKTSVSRPLYGLDTEVFFCPFCSIR